LCLRNAVNSQKRRVEVVAGTLFSEQNSLFERLDERT
jgi:hypothetical protein